MNSWYKLCFSKQALYPPVSNHICPVTEYIIQRHFWTALRWPLEKEMATHSSILAWRIPRTEEPVWLQSRGSESRTQLSAHTHWVTPPDRQNLVWFPLRVSLGRTWFWAMRTWWRWRDITLLIRLCYVARGNGRHKWACGTGLAETTPG